MKKGVVITILIALALIIVWLIYLLVKPSAKPENSNNVTGESMPIEQSEVPANGLGPTVDETIEPAEPLKQIILELRGTASDVTGGQSVRGITTNNTSGEVASVQTADGYTITASFSGLPDPQGDDFYEGWIVKKNPLDPISTGRLTKESRGSWSNTFTTDQDLTGYTFYVLTIEPNDGDPAPADHILEGDLFPV